MQDKLILKQAVIVEGKYDKAKLSSVLDALIITTDGFGIFKDNNKKALIRSLAKSVGIIILTDSDTAGFRIRNHIKGFVQSGNITNIYIPKIKGKERRKQSPSAEGLLGVEGMDIEVLRKTLCDANIIIRSQESRNFLDNSRLMDDELIGSPYSSYKRRKVFAALGLPEGLSTKAAAEIINRLYSEEEYTAALAQAK